MTRPMTSEKKKIAIIGCSYGGISALKTLLALGEQHNCCLEISVINPRAGFINILAIPGAMVNKKLSEQCYTTLQEFGVIWDSIDLTSQNSDNDEYRSVKRSGIKDENQHHTGLYANPIPVVDNVTTHFIQGYVTELNTNSLKYSTKRPEKSYGPAEEKETTKSLEFDFCVIASGRGRKWPFDPVGSTKDEFLSEMERSSNTIVNSEEIVVVGGGALGIEISGEIKQVYREKKVTLIHPHSLLPPEPLVSQKFKEKALDMLKTVGVNVLLKCRAYYDSQDGNSLTLKNGTKSDINGDTNTKIKPDLVYWCNSHSNNISFVNFDCSRHKDEIRVSDQMQIIRSDSTTYSHLFAVGDITSVPIIKTAGGACKEGEVAAQNIIYILTDCEKTVLPLETWPLHSMILTAGHTNTIYAKPDGVILVNDEAISDMYKDYRTRQIKGYMGLQTNA